MGLNETGVMKLRRCRLRWSRTELRLPKRAGRSSITATLRQTSLRADAEVDDDGQPYVAVHASEDVNFDKAKAKVEPKSSERKVKFVPRSYGSCRILPPTPKKDAMGMDYIPIFEDEGGSSVKVSPGKIQRLGVETVTVGKHAICARSKAPGVVQLMSGALLSCRRASMVMWSNGRVVTTAPDVKKGNILAKVSGKVLQ